MHKVNSVPIGAAAAFALTMAASACAGTPVTFAGLDVASTVDAHYTCSGGKEIAVSYVNASNGDSFAYLPVDGTKHVFVAVMSGSGVRYAWGRYIWWNKGNTGKLVVDGDDSAPPVLADCAEKR